MRRVYVVRGERRERRERVGIRGSERQKGENGNDAIYIVKGAGVLLYLARAGINIIIIIM